MPNPVLDRLFDERSRLLDQVESITDAAVTDDRDLSSAELELISRHHTRIADEIDPQLVELERIERTRTEHVRTSPPNVPALDPRNPAPANRGEPELIYRTFAQYARDAIICRYPEVAQLAGGSPAKAAAEERISRAVAHTLTTDVPGLLPPQYLTQIAQVINSSRPIVESARRVTLTAGKLSYPSITQRPLVGKQTAEKTEVPSRTMTVAFVDVLADTYAGAGNLSWQAMNWSTPDALALWFDLAAEEYARQTEAAAGTVLAAAAAGPTVSANDLAAWMAAITSAAGSIYSATRRMADTIYSAVTVGYAFMGLVSNTSPVFLSGGQFSIGSGQGNVAGLRLVISPGLPAGTVVVGASQSLLVAETAGSPVELRAVEPAIGGMEVGVIGAFAAKITEAGAFSKLTAPVIP